MLTGYKKKLESLIGGPRRKGLWTVCWGSTLQLRHSDQQLGESTSSKLQALRSGHADLGESELLNEWCDECQVTCRDKYTCIDKSKSQACVEIHVVSKYIQT